MVLQPLDVYNFFLVLHFGMMFTVACGVEVLVASLTPVGGVAPLSLCQTQKTFARVCRFHDQSVRAEQILGCNGRGRDAGGRNSECNSSHEFSERYGRIGRMGVEIEGVDDAKLEKCEEHTSLPAPHSVKESVPRDMTVEQVHAALVLPIVLGNLWNGPFGCGEWRPTGYRAEKIYCLCAFERQCTETSFCDPMGEMLINVEGRNDGIWGIDCLHSR